MLARSYILSSRCVEIMQSAGKDCALLHKNGDSMTDELLGSRHTRSLGSSSEERTS
ncbi:unnamed protein product [Penicillium roqueforti FM164]|uniref:Genomic scaffold, ProqFM164S01 n=1 Tax=Penicillium roqueforti (strain FM164) TaxID=1365484 RepID=W6PXE4_PENRF|nr:unnamed protein product [Penicillium roqueforti FM164]